MPVNPVNIERLTELINAIKSGAAVGLMRTQLRGTDMEVDAICVYARDNERGGVQIFPYGFMVDGPQIDAIIPPPNTTTFRQGE